MSGGLKLGAVSWADQNLAAGPEQLRLAKHLTIVALSQRKNETPTTGVERQRTAYRCQCTVASLNLGKALQRIVQIAQNPTPRRDATQNNWRLFRHGNTQTKRSRSNPGSRKLENHHD